MVKKIHLLENALRYLLDEGRNAEKAKQKTIAVMKNYLSQNGVQGEQLETMAAEYESSFKEWLFHANMPDSIIRLEPIMANVAMQLGFTPKNKDTRELYRLQDITNYIIASYQNTDFPIALNKLTLDNTSFDSLNELFGSAIDKSKGSWKPSNDDKPKPHYTVKRLDTFEEAHKYHPYTQDICYLKTEKTWDSYTSNGKNAVYVLLRDGWENIPAEHGKNTPYDDYGESMVFVIIRQDSKVAYTNTRWNHNTDGKGPRNVDQSFTENMKKISSMLQTDYWNVLKPYTDEELRDKGILTLSMLQKWLAEGKDILNLCKKTVNINGTLYKCYLNKKKFVLYNIDTDEIKPEKNVELEWMGVFYSNIARIQQNGDLCSFINSDGDQIGDWYAFTTEFHNGFAYVKNDEWESSVINEQGQQICNWYKHVGLMSDGLFKVQEKNNKYSFINTKGQHICGWFNKASDFQQGIAEVQRDDGKWAYMNTHGQIISDWYCNIAHALHGFAPVQGDNGKWTFIDMKGKQICGWYKNVKSFRIDGLASVEDENGTWYTIDKKGNLYDYKPQRRKSFPNESYLSLNNLIAEALHKSIRKYLLYN